MNTDDLAALLHKSLEAHTAQATLRRVHLRSELPSELTVPGDEPWLRRAIDNLIDNAIAFADSPTGQPAHVTIALRSDPDLACVQLEVRNPGAGIAPDALEHIFDRFYKSGDSGGSGLGLAIARQLVLAHGGQIYAQSQPGQGAVISFELPLG